MAKQTTTQITAITTGQGAGRLREKYHAKNRINKAQRRNRIDMVSPLRVINHYVVAVDTDTFNNLASDHNCPLFASVEDVITDQSQERVNVHFAKAPLTLRCPRVV
jgi:hypothetical protein